MFKAARDIFLKTGHRLATASKRLREGDLAKLFLFEFVVVLLGVLVAQGIADWARHRDAMARMEEARARADLEIADAAAVASAYIAIGPCLREDLNTVMRAAANGETPEPRLLKQPRFFGTTHVPLDDGTKLLIRSRYGDDMAYRYDRMGRLTQLLDRTIEHIGENWARLSLVDPELGPSNQSDRDSVREIAAIFNSHLTSIELYSEGIVDMAERLESVPMIFGEEGRLVQDCEEFRRKREMFSRSR